MIDPVDEIRERVEAVRAFKAKSPEVSKDEARDYVEFLLSAPDDMQVLIERIDELAKRVRMYEVVKS